MNVIFTEAMLRTKRPLEGVAQYKEADCERESAQDGRSLQREALICLRGRKSKNTNRSISEFFLIIFRGSRINYF